jgi:hypothetical protein
MYLLLSNALVPAQGQLQVLLLGSPGSGIDSICMQVSGALLV